MLTDAEYREIKENKGTLQGRINQATTDKVYYNDLKVAAQTRKDQLVSQMNLYSNFLSADIAEYEVAHPPAPPPE